MLPKISDLRLSFDDVSELLSPFDIFINVKRDDGIIHFVTDEYTILHKLPPMDSVSLSVLLSVLREITYKDAHVSGQRSIKDALRDLLDVPTKYDVSSLREDVENKIRL